MFQQRRGLSAGQIQWLGRIGLVVSFTIAAFILTRTNAPSNDRADTDPIREDRLVSRSRSAVGPTGDPKAGTRAIETLQVGDRVLAQNPEVSQAERDGFVEPNWDEWLQLSLAMPKGDGSLLEIELLRPETWVREQLGMVVEPLPSGVPSVLAPSPSFAVQHVDSVAYSPLLPIVRDVALAGAELQLSGEELQAIFVEMDLPELAITGAAIVQDIRGPPPIRSGAGRVVTATFKHSSGDVIDLVVGDGSNQTESIGTTSNHPFWSVDRQEYVQAGQLALGERLQTYSVDTKRVVSKFPRPGPQAVYNLEVFAEHVYYVGDFGLLTHNSTQYNASGSVRTGATYNKQTGQGLYALIDDSGSVRYIGRGDAPARLAKHAQSSTLGAFSQVILRNNDLTKAKAKGLENILIGRFGGALSVSPLTNLTNRIRSFSPFNRNAFNYRTSVSPTELKDVLSTLNMARRSAK